MKKLRLFDSLKLVLATVACVFAIMPAHAATLPAGYTELEYLQTDGNSWIDTGIKGDMSYKYEIDFQQLDAGQYRNWGAFDQSRYSGGPNMSLTYMSGFAVRWTVSGNSDQAVNLSSLDSNRHHIIIDNGYVTWDGVNKGRSTGHQDNYVFGYNLFLGTINPGGNTPTSNAKSKYYSYKVWNTSGDLIQNFIPARRDSDGVLGMYDLADANPATAFHTNAGTGEFIAGEYQIKIATTHYNETKFAPVETRLDAAVAAVDTVVTQTMSQAQAIDQIATNKQTRPEEGCTAKYCLLVEDEDGTPRWYPIAGANGVAHNMPAGYTELQYIEFDGNQYMFLPTFANVANIDVTVDVVHTDGDNEQIFFANNSAVIQLLYTTDNSWRVWRSTKANRLIAVAADDRHLITIKTTPTSCEYYVDNQKNTNVPEDFFNSTELSGKRLSIGARRLENEVGYFWKGKIYSFKAECNGVVCINMVPARNSSGEIGMLDLADSNPATAFHTNAGTGTFTAGPDM